MELTLEYTSRLLQYNDRQQIFDVIDTRDHALENTNNISNWKNGYNHPDMFSGIISEVMGLYRDDSLDAVVRIVYFPGLFVERVDNPGHSDSVVNLTSLLTPRRPGREKYDDGYDVSVTKLLNATIEYVESNGFYSHFAMNVANFRQWKDTPHYRVFHDYETKILEIVQAGQYATNEIVRTHLLKNAAIETFSVRLHSKKKSLR